MHGLEVEAVIDRSRDFQQVVVGEVTGVKPHPNADQLRLTEVVVAAGRPAIEIVCGAPNVAVGQKVPVALLGAVLPNGLTIANRRIRGIASNGMLCAEDELGLGKHHAGILVLDPGLPPGTPLAKALGLDQPILDIAIPANRSDLMSVRGLAWEIGAMLGKPPKFPKVKFSESTTAMTVKVNVTDAKLCPLYTARSIRGLTVGPSPLWLQSWLWAAGMRPINVVVDVTNYVMLNYGQPLHAFDAAKVRQQTITVRPAAPGETLVTLDGQARQLDPSMLVIADTGGPIALAGVKGGLESGVTDQTTEIILESAIFDPVSIRKTSRHLGLVSEASKRYEKGLWPALALEASRVAAALIAELGGGAIDRGSLEVGVTTRAPQVVAIDPKYIAERLGMSVSTAKAKTILTKLGFTISGRPTWQVTVPAWRLDVCLPEDIVDEVGRMLGYESIPTARSSGSPTVTEIPPAIRFAEEVKNSLVALGGTEIISHAFYSAEAAAAQTGRHYQIANPLDKTQGMLRRSLLPQMRMVLQRAADAGQDVTIFELGRIFDPELPGAIDRKQPWKIALGATHKGSASVLTPLVSKLQAVLKADIPVAMKQAPERVRGRQLEYLELDLTALQTTSSATFGPWDPERYARPAGAYREPSKYPAITRDISFWWPGDKSSLQALIDDFQSNHSLLWETVSKDEFIKDDRTSYLISFVFQSADRTLTKAEVDQLETQMKTALTKQGASIR